LLPGCLVSLRLSAPLACGGLWCAMGAMRRRRRNADCTSAGMLPPAGEFAAGRVVVFTGKSGAWKGTFSVHSWIVLKRRNEARWTRYDVVGWGETVRLNNWPVDGR